MGGGEDNQNEILFSFSVNGRYGRGAWRKHRRPPSHWMLSCKSNIVISREQGLSYILALRFTSFMRIVFRSAVRMKNGSLSLPSRSKHAYFSTPFNQNLFFSLLNFYKADLNSFCITERVTVEMNLEIHVNLPGKWAYPLLLLQFNPSARSDGHCPHTVNITCRGVTGTARIQ